MKKILTIITGVLIILLFMSGVYADDNIAIIIDGKTVKFDTSPIVKNDRLLVPMRTIFEELGAKVEWDESTGTVTATKNAEYCSIAINSNTLHTGIRSNGDDDGNCIETDAVVLDTSAVIKDDRTLVPLRAVSEALRADVSWDGENKTCRIDFPETADDWMFYASWSDGGKLYKIDSNGQNRQKLSDSDCYNIFLYNNTVYFQTRETDGALFSMGLNGENHKQLTEKMTEIKAINDGKIYYVISDDFNQSPKRGALYSMNLDGTDKKLICDDSVNRAVVYNEEIYYMAEDKTPPIQYPGDLYKIRTDGTDKKRISTEDFKPSFNSGSKVIDGYLYVEDLSSGKLSRINVKTDDVEMFEPVSDYFISESNYLIYRKQGEMKTLYRSDMDGKNEVCIADNISIYSFEHGNDIYFQRGTEIEDEKWTEQLWKCDINGENEKYLFTADMNIEHCGDRIYYTNNYEFTDEGARYDGVYSVNMEGENLLTVTNETVEGYFPAGKYVYIITPNTKKIYKYSLDGTEKTLITNEDTNYEVFLSDGIPKDSRMSIQY